MIISENKISEIKEKIDSKFAPYWVVYAIYKKFDSFIACNPVENK